MLVYRVLAVWLIMAEEWDKSIRIYLIDYGLELSCGHHFSGASVLHSSAEEMGAKLLALAPRTGSFPQNEAPEILPILSHGQYDTALAINTSCNDFISAFNTRRTAVYRDLAGWLSDRIFKEDVALLSTPLTPELVGFTDWYESIPMCQRPSVAVHFVLPIEFELAPNAAWQRIFANKMHSESISRLRTLSLGRNFFACHDARLAQSLSSPGHSLDVHPVPTEILVRNPSKDFCIGVLGQARLEKGLDLAIATVKLLRQYSSYKWVIQTAPMELGDCTLHLREENIKRIAHLPANDEYRNILSTLSVMLLPYDPISYDNFRSSNMFIEAVACGIPVICSDTDFFVEELNKLGCPELIFRPYTPEALAVKIRHVAAEYPKYERLFAANSHEFNLKERAKQFVTQLIRIRQTGPYNYSKSEA